MQQGYPPQQQGYPPQPGYPPPDQMQGGYPPQPGYPPQQSYAPPPDMSGQRGPNCIRQTLYNPAEFQQHWQKGILGLCVGVGLVLLAAIFYGISLASMNFALILVGGFLALLADVALIFAAIMFMVMHYKAWNQIQDGYARATPREAVGLLFVPFFNLYWNFVSYRGLIQDMNQYAQRYGISLPPVSEQTATIFCFLSIGCIVPCLNILAIPAMVIFYFILITALKNAHMAIAQAKMGVAPSQPPM
jgi:hypothetical protein